MGEWLEEVETRVSRVTPGPWFWNSYSIVFSAPLIQAEARLEAEHEAAGEPWDEHGKPAGEWAARFRDVEPMVCWVPSSYGDTATGRHAADADFIAEARTDVPRLLALARTAERLAEALRPIAAQYEPPEFPNTPDWTTPYRVSRGAARDAAALLREYDAAVSAQGEGGAGSGGG